MFWSYWILFIICLFVFKEDTQGITMAVTVAGFAYVIDLLSDIKKKL